MAVQAVRAPGRPPDVALQERRRDDILTAAAAAFASLGFQKTDIQQVADGLGISKGTIYRYFPTKEELFLAAVQRGVQRLYETIDSTTAGIHDPIELLAANVTAYLKFFAENSQLAELFIQERAAFRGSRKPVYFELRDARRGRWRKVVQSLIDAGRVRPVPVERILEVLGDVLYGAMFTNYFATRAKPYSAQAADIMDVVFHGVLTQAERERRETEANG